MLNFRSEKAKLDTKINLKTAKLLIELQQHLKGLELQPYEAVIEIK
jgi:oligo-1,6-glucosidase